MTVETRDCRAGNDCIGGSPATFNVEINQTKIDNGDTPTKGRREGSEAAIYTRFCGITCYHNYQAIQSFGAETWNDNTGVWE